MAVIGNIGLIGGGNMGSALVKGLLETGSADAGQITVAEADHAKGAELGRCTGVTITGGPSELAGLDVLILAVKPADVAACAASALPSLAPQTLVITLAAGVRLATVAAALPQGQPLVRAMPNTPALISQGATALAAAEGVNAKQKEQAEAIFAAVGKVVWVKEPLMDAVTGLSGSGPAYVCLFIEALTDAGVLQGLDRPTAQTLALQTVAGTANLIASTGQHPAQLKDMVTSPGGTTIHGLNILEQGGFRGLVMEAVTQATERSKELGK